MSSLVSRSPYPWWTSYELLAANCQRLGIPVPVIAKVFNPSDPIGATSTHRQHGSRKDLNFVTGGSGTQFTRKWLPVFNVVTTDSVTSNGHHFDSLALDNFTVLCVVMPTSQNANKNVTFVGKGDDATVAGSDWALRGNNLSGSTDYRPGFEVDIGSTSYTVRDPDQWAAGERLCLAATRNKSEMFLWRNGDLKVSNTAVGTGTVNNNKSYIGLGHRDSSSFVADADFELVVIWDQPLPAWALQQLTLDPYQLWADDGDLFSGRSTVVSASGTGAFTLSGLAIQIGASFTPTTTTFTLGGVANVTRLVSGSGGFWLFGHAEEGNTSGTPALLRVDSSTFLLGGSGLGFKTPGRACTSTFTLSARANRVKTPVAIVGFTLTGIAASQHAANRSATSTFNLSGAARLNYSLRKPVTSTFTLFGGAGVLPIEGCETNYAPSPAPVTNEDSVVAVYFQGPFTNPTLSIKLKRPDFGDGRKQTLQMVMRHTRGGDRRTFVRSPTYETLSLHFEGMSRKKLLEFRNFLRATKGQDVRYVDHNNWSWKGIITSPEPDLRTMGFDKSGELDVEFEGEILQ